MSLGDVDGDGDLDAFVANINQPNQVWLNDGLGNFSDRSNRLGSSASLGVSLGDVDGDGDLDAFVANFFQPNQVWLNQNSADLRITKTAGMLSGRTGHDADLYHQHHQQWSAGRCWRRVADSYPVELSDVTWTTVISGSGDVSASGSGDINEDINLTRGSLVTFTVSGTVVDRSHTTSGTRVGSLTSGAAVARIVTHAASVTVPAGTVDSDPSNDIATGSDVVVLEPVAVDDDRVVGFSDFVVLATNFGRETDVGMAGGDFDGNGIVDHADFSALAESFGRKVHPALSAFRPDAADEAFSVGIEIEMANSIDDELLDDLLT